jgi:hypothetical protein
MGQYFRLNGLSGMLIAVALLLTIWVTLAVNAVSVQQREAQNFYKVDKPLEIKMFSSENEKNHIVSGR